MFASDFTLPGSSGLRCEICYDELVRLVLPIVVAGFVAVRAVAATDQLSADELLALKGRELFKAAQKIDPSSKEEYSTADLIRIAAKLGAEQKSVSEDD